MQRIWVVLFFSFCWSTAVAQAQSNVVKLNGGLEAEILSIGRSADHEIITLSLLISNKGKDTANVMLVGKEAVTDNKGGVFNWRYSLAGISDCGYNNDQPLYCAGLPQPTRDTPPLRAYTQIDPDREITVSFRLRADGGRASDGPLVSFSARLAYRMVADPLKDANLTEMEKLKQVRLMTLSFRPRTLVEDR